MNRNYVIINGVNSLTIKGLAINIMPPITKPLMRTMREEIDGRNGDINTELGYQAYDKQIEVGLYGNYDIDEIIAFFNSKGTIVFSDENDKFYNFQILDKIDFANMVKFRTAMINMHCQPFKYPLTDTPVDVAYEYVESTGENLTLDNTEASLLKMDLKGQTSQTTISGKNLFDIATNTSDNYAVNNNISSISGNTMVLNGAGGASSRVIRLQNQVANKTYTVSFNTDITTNRILVRIRKSDDSGWLTNSDITWSGWTYNTTYSAWYYSANASNNKATFTFTVPSGLYWQLGIVNVNSTSATFSNIQLEEGSSATTYEPYVGGIPSPNPQFPQPVNVVSGDNTINVCGKNLFNKSTCDNDKLLAWTTGALANETNSIASDYIKTSIGEQYSFTYFAQVMFYDKDKNYLGCLQNDTTTIAKALGKIVKSLTIPNYSDIYYMKLGFRCISENNNVNMKTADIMVNKGTTLSTYEPYVSSSYPINLPVENLLDLSQFTTQEQDGITFTKNSDGSITINGTATNNITLRTPITPIILEGGTTYTLSKGTTYLGANYSMSLRKQDQTVITDTSMDSSVSSVSFTPSSGVQAYYFQIYIVNGKTFNNHKVYPMIEKGSKENHYTPYGTTPIELCKIGTYQDRIFKSSGKNLLDTSELKDVLNENGASRKGFYFQIQKTGTYYVLFQNLNTQNILYCGKSTNLTQNTTPLSKNSTNHSFTYNFNEGEYFIIWGATDNDANDEIMLSLSSEPIPYEPYGSGKWYLNKEIGKIILIGDNSENWQLATTYTNNVRYNSAEIKLGKTTSLISNYFLEGTGGTDTTNIDTNGTTGQLMITIPKTLASTLEDFETWLGTHNTIVYHQLETPTFTEITEEQLLEQLNAIKQAMSYSGQTNITQENSDIPFTIDATALKKGSDTAVLNNIGNIYSKPVIALKGTGIVNIYNDGVQAFQVDMSEENDITIDTEMMEAYTPTKLANRQVTGDYSKFMIDTGSHDVKFDGELTEATITRYVRWL